MNACRKRKARERYDVNVRKKGKKAALRDHAEEVAYTSLVDNMEAFKIQLLARGNSVKVRISFLKDQYHARVSGEQPRIYTSLGPEFRTKHRKLRLTSQDKSVSEEVYLTSLLTAMINEDVDNIGLNENMQQSSEQFIRVLPILSTEYYNPKAASMKATFAQEIADLATPSDDPVYVLLHAKYSQKILYDIETRASAKLFRVVAIQFVRSYTSSRLSCWEVTCEPVYRDAATGLFHVPSDVQVPGSHVALTHALQGYCVAEYKHGLEDEPQFLPWVDNYIRHFCTVIMPKYSLKDSLPHSKDLPSSRKLRTLKDLPSQRRITPRRRSRSSVPDVPEVREN
jgi:hypothetical protein